MTVAVVIRTPSVSIWWRHVAALAGAALVLLLIFRADIATLAHLWWTSTTFGHCLFIGPVVGWLVWQRRDALALLTPAGWWPGLTVVGAGGAGWFLGEVADVNLARQLGLLLMLEGAVLTCLGPSICRALLFPLGYAVFLVPFGEGLEPPLQSATVWITMHLLHLAGLPAVSDGVLIVTGANRFEVAEACSGAKFEIAMIAYGALVANVCFVAWRRRAAFLAVALIVPVLANGVRAFGTIYAAWLTSVEAATGFDHIVYGWLFFGVVMAAILAIGWRWFDRAPDAPWFDLAAARRWRVARPIEPLMAALLVLATAGVFPAAAQALAGRADALPDRISLPAVPGWTSVAATGGVLWGPNYPGADHHLLGRYRDARGDMVDLAVAVYAGQGPGRELVGFGIGALRENDVWVRVSGEPPIAGGAVMRVTAPGPTERLIATWYRVGDTLTASPVRVKLATLRAKLLGGPQRAVALHVSAAVAQGQDARAAMARFVAALGPIDRAADRLTRGGR